MGTAELASGTGDGVEVVKDTEAFGVLALLTLLSETEMSVCSVSSSAFMKTISSLHFRSHWHILHTLIY